MGSIDEINSVASLLKPSHRIVDGRFARGEMLFVRGWIAVPNVSRQPSVVRLLVDGAYELPSLAGIARPDVAAAFADSTLTHTGFMAAFSTLDLALGEHAVSLFVLGDEARARHDLPAQAGFSVVEPACMLPTTEACDAGRLAGSVDEIGVDVLDGHDDDGGALSIHIRGWACDMARRLPAGDVYGILRDGAVGRAVFGYARPDVSSALGDPSLTYCGFRLRIFTRSRSFERGDVRVIATTADGSQQSPFGQPEFAG